MKEERMAILSMVEKNIISVEDAERLFAAIGKKENLDVGEKVSKLLSKAGDGLSTFAKSVGEKTEKMVEESKPVMKKAGEKLDKVVEEAKPIMKKAADTVSEKAEEIRNSYEAKKQADDEDCFDDEEKDAETQEDDFEDNVTIIPSVEEEKKDEKSEM
ncbi:MAG TPA: hypothetical protein DIC60_01465 [Lachnospiraceae bacterium]|nr:hypothetical protein [Lachnospiraceae bacterium]